MPRKPKSTEHLDKVRHLMGTLPDWKVAEIAGSTPSIVGRYRRKHNIPAYEGYKFGVGQEPPRKGQRKAKSATQTNDKSAEPGSRSKLAPYHDLIGQVPDKEIAALAGVSTEGVRMYRRRHDIKLSFRRVGKRKTEETRDDAKARAAEASKQTPATATATATSHSTKASAATPEEAVRNAPRKGGPRRRKSKLDPYMHLVGVAPDSEVAKLAGVTAENVRAFRRRHGIEAGWRKKKNGPAPAEKPVAAEKPTPAEKPVADVILQGFAVEVQVGETSQNFIVVAKNIAEAAEHAVTAVTARVPNGEVTGIRHLGPAIA